MLAGIALTLVSIWYGQNHGLMPVEASKDAELIDGLFNTMMTISTAIFLLVEGVLVICLIKFRRRPGDETDGPPIEGNIPLEIVWTAIPVVIVLVLGIYSFDVYTSMGGFDPEAAQDPGIVQVAMLPDAEGNLPPLMEGQAHPSGHHHIALGIGASPDEVGKAPDINVNVLGLQYAWIFTYPDIGVTSGELHIPVNKDVRLLLKAQDVIHAFWLPEFRLKQDVMPGSLQSELRFTPQRVGEYPIICAELCGPYHGAMASKLYVHTQEDYDSWLQSQVASQANASQTIAVTDEQSPDAAYLAPFSQQLGIDGSVLQQLHPHQQATASLTPTA
jgi:cytochrome c oxidase subunit II